MSPDQVEFTFWHEGLLVARFALEAGDFVIGRAEACEVIIDLEGMASEQLRLRVGERIFVENLAPGEGTLLGSRRLLKTTEWHPGEALVFPSCAGTLWIGDRDESAAAREREVAGEEVAKWVALMAEKAAWEDRHAALEAELAGAREERSAAESARAHAAQAFEAERRQLEARLSAAAEQGRIGGEAVRIARLSWDAERERIEARLAEATEQARAAAEQARIAADAEREAALAAVREEFAAAQRREQAGAGSAHEWQARVAELEAALRDSADGSDELAELRRELTAERKAFEQQLAALHERHEEETRELQEKLERVEAEAAVEQPAEVAPGRPAGNRDLLSIANKVLFNKLKVSTNFERENDTLRKELKQRELALVTAWADRQRAEERAAQLAKEAAQLSAGRQKPAESPRSRRLSAIALGLALAMALTIAGLGMWGTYLTARARRAEAIVAVVKPSAAQFFQQAKEQIAEGDFEGALEKLACASALEPMLADYRFAAGDAYESLLHLDAARDAYDRGLQLEPSNAAARANLDLCRRILATRHGAASAESMYALHGLMMEQKRLPEALQMAHRLASDRPLLHRTLSAILEEARLPARLDLNGDGSFDLDLSGPGRPDLSVLRQIPLRSLKLARSDVVDLTPLKGLALKKLDLAETRVHDLTPLQGMPLTLLDLSKTDVSNLFPLEKMPLRELLLDDTPVSDISVLQGMPLQSLHVAGTRIRNLAALAGSPLRTLDLSGTRVADIAPLLHLPIERLQLNNTGVVDLESLAGAPLAFLSLTGTEVDDLRPLQKLPIKELALGRCEKLRDVRALAACVSLERLTLPRQITDLEPLRKLPSLRFLSYEKAGALVDSELSAAEFWAAHKSK
ncbi:MAG TPA: hypothetical protein VGO11_14245 [Chthoniobacteraceae bacterium]|jgi:hypothetical protein|nr:hypothetical protein [Chthoniobacteraceae bacterium]